MEIDPNGSLQEMIEACESSERAKRTSEASGGSVSARARQGREDVSGGERRDERWKRGKERRATAEMAEHLAEPVEAGSDGRDIKWNESAFGRVNSEE